MTSLAAHRRFRNRHADEAVFDLSFVEKNRVLYEDEALQVTISLGLATMEAMTTAGSADSVRLADTALYRSKAEGRNKVSVP